VVISTPLDTHEALVREAIALGLPVVCDKPFTPDAASARALVIYSAFARAVRGEGALPVDPRDAVAALEVLDAARRSAARGEVVRLSRAA
jgi:predicted dehydrogenase